MSIKVKKAGLSNLIKRLRELDNKHVKAGILEEDGSQIWQQDNNNPISLAGIGFIHEFGLKYTHTGGRAITTPKRGEPFSVYINAGTVIDIPQRSFIRIPLARNKPDIKKSIKESFINIIEGKSVKVQLNHIGRKMSRIITSAITSSSYAPLTEWAKDRKGSSRPLSGMQKYIKHKVI